MKNQYLRNELNAVASELESFYPENPQFEITVLHVDSDAEKIDNLFCLHAMEEATNELFKETDATHIFAAVILSKPLGDNVKAEHVASFELTTIKQLIECDTNQKRCKMLDKNGLSCSETDCPNFRLWGSFAGVLKKGYYCSELLAEDDEEGNDLSQNCPQHEDAGRLEYGDLKQCVSCHYRKGYCHLAHEERMNDD